MKKYLQLIAILFASTVIAPSAGAQYLSPIDYYGTASDNLNSAGWDQLQKDGNASADAGFIGAAVGVSGIAQGEIGDFAFAFDYDGPYDGQFFTYWAALGSTAQEAPLSDKEDVVTTNPPTSTVVPEPGSFLLLGAGMTGVLCMARRGRQK